MADPSSATTRTIHLYESEYDSGKIRDNGWNWQIAKCVNTSSGALQSNVIWQSKALAPTTSVSWEVEYGLNWTATLPQAGIAVSIGGRWQSCAKGEAYDINKNGFWEVSKSTPQQDWMKVGNVDYKYPGVPGIHIVVGVKNADTGQWDPIFVDSAELPPGSKGVYQPQEKVIWWYASGINTGSVYNSTSGSVARKDVTSASAKGSYEWWTTFVFDDGIWLIQDSPPPAFFTSPPRSENFDFLDTPTVAGVPSYLVTLAKDYISQIKLKTAIVAYYMGKGIHVDLTFLTPSGKEFRISYGPPKSAIPGTLAYVSFASDLGDSSKDEVERALEYVRDVEEVLPKDETWTIA